MAELAGRPYWELTFDKSGALTAPTADDFVQQVQAAGISELFVFSHGWGNSTDAATRLYSAMFPLIEAGAATIDAAGERGYVGIFWPSLWFPDPPADQAAAVAAAVVAGRPGAATAALSGAQIAQTLSESFPDPEQKKTVAQLGQLIDAGLAGVNTEPDQTQDARLASFHSQLTALLPPRTQPDEDNGGTAVTRTNDPKAVYATLASAMGSSVRGGDAQDLASTFGKIWAGAKDALRTSSYWEMKARAGDIGEHGLGPLLERLHQQAPAIRVHLIGHSFGARLVSFALKGISSAAASPVCSLSLVQGAFSHYAFSGQNDMPFGHAGALHAVADRVHGPLVSTFSSNDWAVGKWYPRASFAARQDAEAKVDPMMRWGGFGADGYQAVEPLEKAQLLPDGTPYQLTPGQFYAYDASAIVADVKQSSFSGAHSDIRHPEIAWLLVSAARAVN
jgi:hypothetical protein